MSKSSSSSTSTQQAIIPEMSTQEQGIVNRLQSLGMGQADALQAVMDMARQPQGSMLLGLQGSDKALLDEAFSGAEAGLRHQANLMGQDLASSRGFQRHDTPVAGAVMQNFLPALAQIQAQKASQSLGLGLSLGQLGEQRRMNNMNAMLSGGTAMPSALAGLANRFQQERFAGAKTVGTQHGTSTPSVMSGIGQGLGLAGQIGSLGMGIMSGMGGMGAGAAGAGAGAGAVGPMASGYQMPGFSFGPPTFR